MKGINRIVVNQDTMKDIVQFYFVNILFKDFSGQVTSVTADSYTFEVLVTDEEKKTSPQLEKYEESQC